MKPLGRPFGATIVITSLNSELLSLCRCFIPPDVRVLVIDGQDGRRALRSIGYAIENVEDDRAILLDEDAFILDFSRVQRLLEWGASEDLACIGMSDGGVLPIRQHNPNAMNPFFNIIDLAVIRSLWDPAAILSHQGDGATMTSTLPPQNVLTPGVPYNFDDFEPYYCFYFWLVSNGLRLDWLSGSTHTDGISTILHDKACEPLLIHTWYGRCFGKDPVHTSRILQAALWASGRRPVETIDLPEGLFALGRESMLTESRGRPRTNEAT
jgi:hypothetical protein